MKYYYLLNGKIMAANEKMLYKPHYIISGDNYNEDLFNSDYNNWINSLQPCEISESELLKIHNYLFTKKSIDSHTGDGVNPIEVTDIVDEKEIRTETKSGSWIDYELCFKPKQAEEIEAVDEKLQKIIDWIEQAESEGIFQVGTSNLKRFIELL